MSRVKARTLVLANGSLEQHFHQRYSTAVEALHDDAREQDREDILAGVLAQTLAKMIVHIDGPIVAGVILLNLGHHVCELVERKEAEAAVEQARKDGRKLH